MGVVQIGLDHPDTIPRMLRAFDAGLDTVAIAAFTQVPEPEVCRILVEEREIIRRNRRRTGWARFAALTKAYYANDIDRREVARRFGYASAASASSAVSWWRRKMTQQVTA